MNSRLRLLTALNAVLLLSAFGCGDEGSSCGPAPQKSEEQSAAGGGSGTTGSTSSGGDIIIQDKRGRVPKPYQRTASADDQAKSTATITKPVVAAASTTVRGTKPFKPGIASITKRRVDGIEDRVEVTCRLMAASSDGQCATAANYDEIKERCCPGGLVERCKTTMSGIVLIGRGCTLPAR